MVWYCSYLNISKLLNLPNQSSKVATCKIVKQFEFLFVNIPGIGRNIGGEHGLYTHLPQQPCTPHVFPRIYMAKAYRPSQSSETGQNL